MTNQQKTFLFAGLVTLAGALTLGFSFRHTKIPNNAKASANILAAEPSGSAGSASKMDYLAVTAAEAARWTAADKSASATRSVNLVYSSSDAQPSVTDSRTSQVALTGPAEAEPETSQPHIPLAFFDYTSVLPNTPEVAATIQKLRQDFIDSTGAATANPADPDYAALWNQFQPTADDIFCAIFGTEACNAMSIERRRQLGHF